MVPFMVASNCFSFRNLAMFFMKFIIFLGYVVRFSPDLIKKEVEMSVGLFSVICVMYRGKYVQEL